MSSSVEPSISSHSLCLLRNENPGDEDDDDLVGVPVEPSPDRRKNRFVREVAADSGLPTRCSFVFLILPSISVPISVASERIFLNMVLSLYVIKGYV